MGRPGNAPQCRVTESDRKIQIRARNVKLTNTERADVERRLRFAQARFGERIGRVIVRFLVGAYKSSVLAFLGGSADPQAKAFVASVLCPPTKLTLPSHALALGSLRRWS